MREEDLSYFEEDEFKESLARYEDMLNGGPSVYLEADELTDIAEYYLVNNDEERANACIEYALQLHPGDVDPLVFKARQAMFKGDLDKARSLRDSITDPADREVYFLNAELMIREKREDEAEHYLHRLADEMESEKELFIYDSACIFLDYGLYNYAEEWSEWLMGLQSDAKACQLKGEVYLATEQYEDAISVLDTALDLDPYSLTAWNMMAEAHFMREEFYEAIEAADFALAIDETNARAQLMKANSHFHQGHNEEAHEAYQKYIEEHEADELPYFFDGICLTNLNRLDEALAQLRKAEALAQGMSVEQQQLYLQLAFVYSKLKAAQTALFYLEKAREEDKNNLEYNLLKGHILQENGDVARATACFEQAIEESKNPARTKHSIAVSLSENGRYGEAVTLLLEVIQEDPENMGRRCYAYLAYCFLKLERYDDYLFFLNRAGHDDPDNAQFIFGDSFPGIRPEEYYPYAYKEIKGVFPDDSDHV